MSSSPSTIDKFTGLPNREAGHGIINGSINHNGRVALLMCDINGFKTFNCSLGHAEGDRQLLRLARSLKEIVAPFPVFRSGDDEFCAVIQERSLEEVRQMATLILEAQKPDSANVEGQNKAVTITLSIGIALFPYDAFDAQSLWQAAEAALLKAKQNGQLGN